MPNARDFQVFREVVDRSTARVLDNQVFREGVLQYGAKVFDQQIFRESILGVFPSSPLPASFVSFGVGLAWAEPVAGNLPGNYTPSALIGLNDIKFNRSAKITPLRGLSQYPDGGVVSDKEIRGTATLARIDADLWNNLFMADSATSNSPVIYPGETHFVPSVGPYTVPVSNIGTFVADLGVRYPNGQPMENLQGGTLSVAGQYNVAGGTYMFSSLDAGLPVNISYEGASASGTFIAEHNQLSAWSPILRLFLWEPCGSDLNLSPNNGFVFYNVVFGGLENALKYDDWDYPQVEWTAFADPTTMNAAGEAAIWGVIDGANLNSVIDHTSAYDLGVFREAIVPASY